MATVTASPQLAVTLPHVHIRPAKGCSIWSSRVDFAMVLPSVGIVFVVLGWGSDVI